VIAALGLEGQVSQAPAVIRRQQQFLAVRRGAGMDLLVQRFAAELKRFKQEPAYAALSAKYGGIQSAARRLHCTNTPLSSRKAARGDCSVILGPSRQAYARPLRS